MADLCFPPATRAKSIPPRMSWSPPREALRKKDSSELWERAQARALDMNGDVSASSSNSSEDAFEDSAPRLSSRFSSATSSASDYQDANSDLNSVASSFSSVDDDALSEGIRSIHSTPNGKSAFAATSDPHNWRAKLKEEQKARRMAEEALEQLREQRDELQRQLYAMEEKASEEAAKRREQLPAGPSESSSEAVVARMVAGIFARVATNDAVGARWAGEVARLRQRLEQSARMEAVAERRRQQELAAQETLNRRLLHAGFAASCAGLGILGVFLVVRSSSRV